MSLYQRMHPSDTRPRDARGRIVCHVYRCDCYGAMHPPVDAPNRPGVATCPVCLHPATRPCSHLRTEPAPIVQSPFTRHALAGTLPASDQTGRIR